MNGHTDGNAAASPLPVPSHRNRSADDDAIAYFPGAPKFTTAEVVERLRALLAGRVTAAYLFGSYARGTAHGDSDIDLIIVAPTAKRWPQRAWEFNDLASALGAIDVLVYTPEEWLTMQAEDHPFVAAHRHEWLPIL